MLKSRCLTALSLLALAAPGFAAAESQAPVPLIAIYKSIHAHPELSHFEEQTSAVLAGELRAAGYAVTDHIGVYPDGSRAFGVVGVLKNGSGPTLLIRADMDALPIVEETGLDGHQIPVTYYWLGAMNPEKFQAAAAAGRQLPGPHNSHFEPDPEPTLATGVRSMTAVAMALLK